MTQLVFSGYGGRTRDVGNSGEQHAPDQEGAGKEENEFVFVMIRVALIAPHIFVSIKRVCHSLLPLRRGDNVPRFIPY